MPFFPNFDKLLVSYARQGRADFSPYAVDNSVDNWVFDNWYPRAIRALGKIVHFLYSYFLHKNQILM